MLLAIDIGNTNLVFALMVGETIAATWRVETHRLDGGYASVAQLKAAFDSAAQSINLGNQRVTRAVMASVVPEASAAVHEFAGSMGVTVLQVGTPECDLGIEIKTDNPAEVGADRLVNTIAAYDLVASKAIVIDFGTATTFDVVGSDGAYLGGLICPGINLSLRALGQATSKLPHVNFEEPGEGDAITGKNTKDAIQHGIYWGYVSMVEGLISRLQAEHGPSRVIATGGLAGAISHHCTAIQHVDATLTLQGLRLIAARNRI